MTHFTLKILLINFVFVQPFSNPINVPFLSLKTNAIAGGERPSLIDSNSISNNARNRNSIHDHSLFMSDSKNDGVVELVEDDETEKGAVSTLASSSSAQQSAAPFLSQGEIEEEALQLTDDPKQTRVIIYIIISLVPVLFLVPLMLGSRDLIPLDVLPPVELN